MHLGLASRLPIERGVWGTQPDRWINPSVFFLSSACRRGASTIPPLKVASSSLSLSRLIGLSRGPAAVPLTWTNSIAHRFERNRAPHPHERTRAGADPVPSHPPLHGLVSRGLPGPGEVAS